MVIGYVLLAIALTELFLGLRFIFAYEKQQSTIWYGLFCIGVAMYVGANAFGFLGASGRWSEHFAWLGGALATTFFLPFTFSFPLPRKRLSESLPWVIWPLVIFIPGFLFTGAFVKQEGIVLFAQGYSTATGDFMWFFLAFFAVYWVWSIANLLRSLRSSGGIQRLQLRVLLSGLLLSLLGSGYFDIYTPLTQVTHAAYWGSLFTSAWLGVTSYVILKH